MFGKLPNLLQTGTKKKDHPTKTKPASYLSDQKTSSRPKTSYRTKFVLQMLFTLLLLIGIGALGVKYKSNFFDYFFGVDRSNLQISIYRSNSSHNTIESKLLHYIGSEIKDLSIGGLNQVAKSVQAKFELSHINIARVGIQELIVDYRLREALFIIFVDQPRYVSSNGQIYGHVDNLAGESSLTQITNIFEDLPYTIKLRNDNTLELSTEQKERISEAVQLIEELQASKLDERYRTIKFDRFRGFTMVSTDNSEVLIGRTPFTEKLKKLLNILSQSEKKGMIATRVELDYVGKAFVKEKAKAL